MRHKSVVSKTLLFGFLFLSLGSFPFLKDANAQSAPSPQFLVTWKASGSYIPSFYQGKALPSYGSKITASLEIISNGAIVNIGFQPIYWYLDEVLIGGGVGVKQVTFSPFGSPPSTEYLTVELPQYGATPLEDEVQIPFVSPLAVISAPYPNQQFSTNPVEVTAIPFFFNASSASALSFTWAVNGQTGGNAENPQVADITVPQDTSGGTSIEVSLSIENPIGSTIATANQSLTYQHQL